MAIQNAKVERVEAVEVDINDTSLAEGVESILDLTEDFQARSAPPPGRTDINKPKMYKLRLFIDDESFEQGTKQGFAANDPNGKYYSKQIVCKIQDPAGTWQDSVAYYKVSTGIPKGKKISSMAGLMGLVKVKVPAKITDLALARLLVKAFTQLDGPMVIGDCDWSAWDKTKTGKRKEFGDTATIALTGKLATSMANFPKTADGTGYQHIAFTKEGLEITARLKVLKLHAAVSAAKPTASSPVKPAAAVKPVVVAPVTVESVIEEPELLQFDNDDEIVLDA